MPIYRIIEDSSPQLNKIPIYFYEFNARQKENKTRKKNPPFKKKKKKEDFSMQLFSADDTMFLKELNDEFLKLISYLLEQIQIISEKAGVTLYCKKISCNISDYNVVFCFKF